MNIHELQQLHCTELLLDWQQGWSFHKQLIVGSASGVQQLRHVLSDCTLNVKQEVEVGQKAAQDNCYCKGISVKKRKAVLYDKDRDILCLYLPVHD